MGWWWWPGFRWWHKIQTVSSSQTNSKNRIRVRIRVRVGQTTVSLQDDDDEIDQRTSHETRELRRITISVVIKHLIPEEKALPERIRFTPENRLMVRSGKDMIHEITASFEKEGNNWYKHEVRVLKWNVSSFFSYLILVFTFIDPSLGLSPVQQFLPSQSFFSRKRSPCLLKQVSWVYFFLSLFPSFCFSFHWLDFAFDDDLTFCSSQDEAQF